MELTVKKKEISDLRRTGKFDAKRYSVKTGINICVYVEFSVLESLGNFNDNTFYSSKVTSSRMFSVI